MGRPQKPPPTPFERIGNRAVNLTRRRNARAEEARREAESLMYILDQWDDEDVRVSGCYHVGRILGDAYRRATEERLEEVLEELEELARRAG